MQRSMMSERLSEAAGHFPSWSTESKGLPMAGNELQVQWKSGDVDSTTSGVWLCTPAWSGGIHWDDFVDIGLI
jgi:hypothetical protein